MDIKMECENFPKLCHGCLSAERNIQHVTGELSDIFYKLRNDDENEQQGEQLQLCWECVAILKKLKTFQERIKKAQILLLDHLKSYCIKGEAKGTLSLSTLNRILMKTYNAVYYNEDSLNNKSQKIKRENIKRRKLNKEKDKSNNLNKDKDKNSNLNKVQDKTSDLNIENFETNDENNDLVIEMKLESNDNIKQEGNDFDNDNNLDFYEGDCKDDDNSCDGMSTDYCTVECKVENDFVNSMDIKKENISLNNGINKRRKYARFATITRNDYISTKNYKEISRTVCLSQKEYEDILKKERDRLGNRLQFKCDECKETYLKNIDLLRHISFCHNKSCYPQKCTACSSTIICSDQLAPHWTQTHTVMLKCMLCSDLYRSVAEIKRHIRDMHIKTYTCNECALVCSTFTDFMRHYKSHESVVCDHCRSKFRKKSSLIRHIKLAHTPVSCNICNLTFSNQKRFKYHNHMNHPEMTRVDTREDLSYCVECDKQYPSVLKYRRHLQQSARHTQKKKTSVPCPACGKVFTRTNFMRNHYKFAHLKITKNYCDKCQKYYTTGYGLRQHIERVHEKIAAPKNKVCDLCGRAFGTNKILENHRRTHTGEKPYKCVYCPASFAQQTAMKTHQKTQHKPDKLISALSQTV